MNQSDFDRNLTQTGRQQIIDIRQHLEHLDLCVTSPLVRAQQTAEIAIENLDVGQMKTSETLAPEASISDLITWLETVDSERILLVSHNPFVSVLAQWLTGDSGLNFGTGNLALLEGDFPGPDCMTLSWLRQAN